MSERCLNLSPRALKVPGTLNEVFQQSFKERLLPGAQQLLSLDVNLDGYVEAPQEICVTGKGRLTASYLFWRETISMPVNDLSDLATPREGPLSRDREIQTSPLARQFLLGIVRLFGVDR